MNRIRIAIVGLALLATGCSGTTNGGARPGTTTETPTGTSSSSADDMKLVEVKPCELITTTEASSIGLTAPPEARKLAGTETCEWIDKNGGILVNVEPKRGAEDINYKGQAKTSSRFGKYDGFKIPGEEDSCDAVIAVTAKSSVQISASTGSLNPDVAKACELATKSAELVAAKLP